jgi:nitric oxide reductase NorQ protein
MLLTVTQKGNQFIGTSSDGDVYTESKIPRYKLRRAFNESKSLQSHMTKTGKLQWRFVDSNNIETISTATPEPVSVKQSDTINFIHSSFNLKPTSLVITELKWKYLIRSAMRGRNIMMTGAAGCGKTISAKALINALDRPDFTFNMGATQDPRATLIGNTHYSKDEGTYFSESLFVKAIQTENAIILLDELTRAHPDAWNILMPVLDYGQRYLRLDEAAGQKTIKVANGVTFISTANIGSEYTATRVLDKALMDRFTIIEMDLLSNTQEYGLLQFMFPTVSKKVLENISDIAHLTRVEASNSNPRIDSGISTRTSVEIASLLFDGFTLEEAADITIYPQYDGSGGVDSERTFVKQIVQKFIDDGSDSELFSENEVKAASNYYENK